MGGRVSLSLVIHNHQPVGNFGWVMEDVYEHAYGPMIDALERHPGIRIGLHYTGPLLQWMIANRPAAIRRITALADHGQVEIVGGGFYEPILVSLPDRDRHGQLVRMATELETIFGHRPRGAWLAERVWEPSLPNDLATAGYEWTVVDDNHLRAASIPEDEMWTAFTTDDRGRRLTVFGTEQGLRYRIPFKPVEDLIDYLRTRRTADGRFVGMMGDDGEKFGAWPGTFEYCWSQEHWVDRCFEAIEKNADWLSMVTPSEWLGVHPPTVRVYVPNNSYLEMTEWALPPAETNVFTPLIEKAREANLPEARFLRGGFWRNFTARYREINELHKQMLRTSELVAAMPEGPAKEIATDHLYQGQSNDCYWHGLFGGIYIPHMRMATFHHLIAAEDIAAGGVVAAERAVMADVDLDAVNEAVVASPGQTLVVDVAEGAGISTWDLRATRMALASVLRRRPEAYHLRLIEHERREAEGHAGGDDGGSGPKTIHDIVTTKEPGLAQRLHYDGYERRSALVHLLANTPRGIELSVRDFVTGTYEELGSFLDGGYEVESFDGSGLVVTRTADLLPHCPVAVTKSFSWSGGRLDPRLELEVAVENRSTSPLDFEMAIEWNVNLLGGGHNPAAFYETDGAEPVRTPHDGVGDLVDASRVAFGNDYEGVRIEAFVSPAARLTWYPVETVSNSEAGFERVYQGSCLLARWPVRLATGARESRTIRFEVVQTVDRSPEELARA